MGVDVKLLYALAALAVGAAAGQTASLPNEFLALDTAIVPDLRRDFLQRSKIEILKKLGYPGLAVCALDREHWRHLVDNVIPCLDEKQLKLYAVYSGAWVARGNYGINPELKANLPHLAGRGTVIWLPISSREFKPSGPAGDDMAVAPVGEVAEAAAAHGLTVSLYPHVNDGLERVSDAVRIAEKTGRKDVGVTLNLCHWLKVEGADTMELAVRAAIPRLTVVTINGADRDGRGWTQPLDSGNFDVAAFLRALHRAGYRGPIGLQGFTVADRYHVQPVENLRRSMTAWKNLSRLTASKNSP